MTRAYFKLMFISIMLIVGPSERTIARSAAAQNADIDIYQPYYTRESITGYGWQQIQIREVSPLLANDRGLCPIRHDVWDRKNKFYSIINLIRSACIYRGGKFEARQIESLEFQPQIDATRQYIWTVEEIGSRVVTRLLSDGKIGAIEFPAGTSAWQIVSNVGSRDAKTLLLRRRDGSRIRAVVYRSGNFEVYEKSISGSQYASLVSPIEINFIDLCSNHTEQLPTSDACSVKDATDPEKVYQIGACENSTTPVIYLHGGPFAPALPQIEVDRARRLLTGSNSHTRRLCLMIPRLATSSDSFTDVSFETAITRANRHVRDIALSKPMQNHSIESAENRRLVIAESFGSQSLYDLIETNQALDIIFFSALLDEVKFAQNFGAITETPGEANLSVTELSQIQDELRQVMRRQAERPSFWRVKQYITWLSGTQKPILLRACERKSPTRIVVVRSANDPRATIDQEIEKRVSSTCSLNGHELEFVTSDTGGHATSEIASLAFNNSQLLRKISSEYWRGQ